MKLPRFILGDNTDVPDSIFIIHTEFPRFIIDLKTDDIEWFENFDVENEEEFLEETNNLVKEASEFYDREVDRYQ
ncbi:hypothetical protein ES731_00880 [Psychroflexus gondwanensis]|jgi:hypothetical protein|uniref:Uncharacterized protein n=2 Tax=Psychroflexus TaxID=83612 RepID=N1WKT0_9FLAO|nr:MULTISPECIES: hypothetical protein [Psychroflexus]AFU69340.1 hypothetical protein P700755_002592 [Psychroflexus torquis ATCC 700755]EMY80861.1 hypothetical protein pgond44_09881 [Psychroflexus gondwanensis ACAM 44]PKG41961.1 hypothetical protein CXF67_12940 [Psychroflexus sp. MES1-P1E]TXE21497.1 hypothetical protein ES731_00880 [Psychroflexus gondwanensis]